MTIQELEAFINAAESEIYVTPDGSVHRYSTSAAEEILHLEKELGCVLFDRQGMASGRLTKAGEALLPMAIDFVRRYHAMVRAMDPYKTGERRTLYVGHLPILRQYRLNRFFRNFEDEHPECELHLEEGEVPTLLKGLNSGYFDAIVARRSQVLGNDYEIVQLAADEVAAIVCSSHPAAKRKSITLRELKNESFYLSNPHSGSYSFCRQLLIASHISTENVHTADIDKILDTVRRTHGVALLPISTLNVAKAQGLAAVPLQPEGSIPVVLACRKNHKDNTYLDELMAKAKERAKAIPAI